MSFGTFVTTYRYEAYSPNVAEWVFSEVRMQNRGGLLRLDFKPQSKGFLRQVQDGPSYVEDKTPTQWR